MKAADGRLGNHSGEGRRKKGSVYWVGPGGCWGVKDGAGKKWRLEETALLLYVSSI